MNQGALIDVYLGAGKASSEKPFAVSQILARRWHMKATLSVLAVWALLLLAACDHTVQQTFKSPVIDVTDVGARVALDGNHVLISAYRPDIGREVYLFSAFTGRLQRTFNDPNDTGSFNEGDFAVDGDRILIGDPWDDTYGPDIGQAYLFDAATGALLRTFDDLTPTSYDHFGAAVALDDGRVLIGAPRDDTNGVNVGQVHLLDAATGARLQTFDDPTPTDGDRFGSAVAIDGDLALIGEPWGNSGRGEAHLFNTTTGVLLQTFGDQARSLGRFGWAVAVGGGRVLIGEPAADSDHIFGALDEESEGYVVGKAYLFDASTGGLLRTFEDPTGGIHRFGQTVAVNADYVLIGAPNPGVTEELADEIYQLQAPYIDLIPLLYAGRAYLFSAANGALLRIFKYPEVTLGGDYFGAAVALDNSRALIGAPHPYFFVYPYVFLSGEFKNGEAYLFKGE
jgi:outer membrane protein assembly factor BamB